MQPQQIFEHLLTEPHLKEYEVGKVKSPRAIGNRVYADFVDDQHNVYRISVERLN